MPRLKTIAAAGGKPISIRLPPDEEAYYRKQAAAHRMPLNAFLAKTLIQGVIVENMLDFEERVKGLIAQMQGGQAPAGQAVPDYLAVSVLTCEHLMLKMFEAQNAHVAIREAQELAKAAFKRRKES